jgi:peptidoglycan/LPS O-acetylase OafA/YrhL
MPTAFAPSTHGNINGHIKELDGLRGIAIGLVLIHHFWPSTGYWTRFSDIAHLGWIGVDLFFVISGFLITGILLETVGKPDYYRNFYARRVLRIYPLYYLFLAFAFLIIPALQEGSYWQTDVLRQSGSPLWYVCYLGNIREALTGKVPAYFLAPLWSLAIEEQFYISFPLLAAAVSRRCLAVVLSTLVLFAPAFRIVTLWLSPENDNMQYVATFSRVDVIALGCLLAVWFRAARGVLHRKYTTLVLLVMLAVFVVTFLFSGLDRPRPFCRIAGYSLTGFTFAVVTLWVIQNRATRWTALLRFGPLCSMGTICYGIYLLHRPVETLLIVGLWTLGIDFDPGSLYLMLGKIGAAVLIAAASWVVVEKRFLRWKRFFASAYHPSTGADSAQTDDEAGVLVSNVAAAAYRLTSGETPRQKGLVNAGRVAGA